MGVLTVNRSLPAENQGLLWVRWGNRVQPRASARGCRGELKINHGRDTPLNISSHAPALAHKAHLPAGVKGKVHGTKEAVQAKVEQVKQHLQEGAETVQDKAGDAALQARTLTNQARAKVPAPVAGRIEQLRDTVRQRPVPAIAVMLGVLLVLRLLLRRNR